MATGQVGKIALVTGGNRGIGYAACEQLADLGLHVILTSRDAEKGEQAARELRTANRSVSSYPLEVTDPASVDRLREYVMREYGRLDVLVNNAAVYLDEGVSVFDVTLDVFRQTMETTCTGRCICAARSCR